MPDDYCRFSVIIVDFVVVPDTMNDVFLNLNTRYST